MLPSAIRAMTGGATTGADCTLIRGVTGLTRGGCGEAGRGRIARVGERQGGEQPGVVMGRVPARLGMGERESLAGGDLLRPRGVVGVVLSIKEKAVPPSVSLRSADAKFEVTKASISEILEAAPTTES